MKTMSVAIALLACVWVIPNDKNEMAVPDSEVSVRIDSIELSKFNGETIAAEGATKYKVPKIHRAIVLTLTIEGPTQHEVPRLWLNNSKLITPKLFGKTLRSGMQQLRPSENGTTWEAWFPVDQTTALNAMFPCTVEIATGETPETRKSHRFKNISP